ncbi:isoprenylcysteine carboxylmethyltransferase family protein [Dokdonella soli]|uniref:Phosphatidylethanolamine N-methyltransferase family protein n=1 Tax=Dokdonella soli TaxID=529810 RepID=A0ABN1IWY0_9GAMM
MERLRNIAVAVFVLWLLIDGLVVFRRKSGTAENRDRFSLRVIAAGNLLAWTVGIWLAYKQIGVIRPTMPVQIAGLVSLGLGILIRSTAIAQLGRFHTPNVAVLANHEVMDRGLYRHIRHPSYLGALIAFFGFGLALGNWPSLLVIMLLTPPIYLFRIREEEAALGAALGERYASYCRRTKRLIPGIY